MQRPDDPRDWSADDVEDFALHATGNEVLSDALTRGPRPRYASALLMMLWRTGRGDFGPDLLLEGFGPLVKELDSPEGTDEAARRALSDYLAEAIVNPDHLTDIGTWLQQVSILPTGRAQTEAASDVVSLLGEASIRLSPSLLDD
jgi:hypothetical protein